MGLGQSAVVQVLLRERIRISGSVMPIVRDAHAVEKAPEAVLRLEIEDAEFRWPTAN